MTVFAPELGGVGGPQGSRDLFALTGRQLCDAANDRILKALSDEDRERFFIAALDVGLRRGDRTCIRTYAEMRGLVGTKIDLALNVVQLIGGQPAEARSALDAQRNVAALAQDRPAMAAKLARWLLEYSAESGEPLSAIMARASGAEVVEACHATGNGNGGGADKA
jgi:hypothetical protein